jgi:hypothetical protein
MSERAPPELASQRATAERRTSTPFVCRLSLTGHGWRQRAPSRISGRASPWAKSEPPSFGRASKRARRRRGSKRRRRQTVVVVGQNGAAASRSLFFSHSRSSSTTTAHTQHNPLTQHTYLQTPDVCGRKRKRQNKEEEEKKNTTTKEFADPEREREASNHVGLQRAGGQGAADGQGRE